MNLLLDALKLALLSLFVVQSVPQGENVALKKPVRGNILNSNYVTDGTPAWDAMSQNDTQPFWFIDLGAVYKINTIQLYTRGNVKFGYNIPFTIYSWAEFTSPCDLLHHYPWKTVVSGLIMNGTKEMREFTTDFEAQYIIVMPDREDQLAMAPTITVSELKAFGVKVKDAFKPDYSSDPEVSPNAYTILRQQLCAGQGQFWVEQNLGEYVPDYELGDVAIGWYHNRVNTMAVTRGKGHIMLLSGKAGMEKTVKDEAYEPFRNNLKVWLGGNQVDPKFEPVSDSPTKGAILLITRDDKFDVKKIHDLIVAGTNNAIFGYVHEGNQEDDATKLLTMLKIKFLKTSLGYMGRNIILKDLKDSQDYIPAWIMLESATKSWKVLAKWSFLSKVHREDYIQPRFQELIKVVLEKYKDYAQYYTACDYKYQKPDEANRAAIYNLNRLYIYQVQKPIIVLPGTIRHPGYISPALKSETYTVTLRSPGYKNYFLPTGGYAKAGGDARYKVIKKSTPDLKGFSIRVNAQTDNLRNNDQLRRWPIATSFYEVEEEGELPTAIGGPIVMGLPQDAEITIEFKNVYRYPWFDIRDPKSVENWEAELEKRRHVPFTMIMGDAMITQMPTAEAAKMNKSHIQWSTTYFDNSIKIMHNYRGSDVRTYPFQIFVMDAQITHGWGHAGYPFMAFLPWAKYFIDLQFIRSGQCIGIPHEIGHNLQLHGMTLKGGTEVTNNMFIPVIHKYLLNISALDFGYWPGFAKGDEIAMVNHWKSGVYNNVGVGYYNYFGQHFTPALVGNALANVLNAKVPLNTEERKINFWIQQLCKESQYDLLPWNRLFNFPITEETEKVCAPFPCFIPDDKLTKQVPDLIEAVIKKSGKKECLRSNPKPVEFKIPILRNVNENAEPIIRFH